MRRKLCTLQTWSRRQSLRRRKKEIVQGEKQQNTTVILTLAKKIIVLSPREKLFHVRHSLIFHRCRRPSHLRLQGHQLRHSTFLWLREVEHAQRQESNLSKKQFVEGSSSSEDEGSLSALQNKCEP